MHQFIKISLLLSAFYCHSVYTEEWFETGNFYQIYPRSFMDSNGDGIGDLNGIKSKLEYLHDLGMDGVWLSPIYKSPNADFGYDISDFRDIHELFGSLDDFDKLVQECNRLGLKLILDFVPNHSSDEHDWFKRSESKESGYEDFYIWRDPKIDEISNIPVPPNNWMSTFRYSAWKWSEVRKQMYYHMFHYKQPDLNYRNPKVVQEMKDVLTYWLDRGVAGFRIDAVPSLFEDESLRDEPRSYRTDCDQFDHCSLQNIYTEDQKETYDMVQQWRKHLDEYSAVKNVSKKVIMVESYAKLDYNMLYYGNESAPGAHFPFNFELIKRANINSTAEDYKSIVEEWLTAMPKGNIANWVLGNHDNHRLASRLGEKRGDLLNFLLQTLPGAAITYQGEELVMSDVYLTWNETVDPQACNSNPTIYESRSRDPARTPFPWDNTKNAGFSTANKTWLPVGNNYKTVNVKAQQEAKDSHLKIFKKLTSIRKKEIFKKGDYLSALSNNKQVYSYKRQYQNEMAIVVLNFGISQEIVNLTELFKEIPSQLEVYVTSLDSGIISGSKIETSKVRIPGSHAIILVKSAAGMIKANILMIFVSSLVYFIFRN
ncbi:hypothetical protein PVAND_001528 [Polypedilum vanderplanki]|uniref:alpha-glucosidase n=1 Tax=Polypedilum vanderplanki TaxID=319348 RepID=A0A9J6BNP8_POLVA|nr:hypothetical protein PVAND_001528 [Polypedilum vanderplanki]